MITLIDGSNMLHRAMYNADSKLGIHPLRELYLRFMSCPDNTIVVWDGMHSKKRRRDLFPGYKQRPDKAEDVAASFDIMKELLCHCYTMQVEIPYWEADDVLATLALDYANGEQEVTIESNDQDFYQLTHNPLISLPMMKSLPCLPEHTCVYKALVGDSSDTIPGWKGFGPARWGAVSPIADQLERCLRDKDWESWEAIDWPKGIKPTQDSFFQCCIFYEIVQLQRVPEADFENNYLMGKPSPAMAEEILGRWRI